MNTRIAVAANGDLVSEHFGHCEHFLLFDCQDNSIIEYCSVASPPHQPGFLPQYLSRLGVNVVITGGMGERAKELFAQQGIKVVTGVQGPAGDAVKNYLNGKLVSRDVVCEHHGHHECGHD